jgi:hypothetical protein
MPVVSVNTSGLSLCIVSLLVLGGSPRSAESTNGGPKQSRSILAEKVQR